MPLLPDMVIIAEEVLATDCGGRTEVRNTVSLGASSGHDIARFNWPTSQEPRGRPL